MVEPRVDVLLATFNSSRYLAELLDSLAQQSYADFRLIVSDDCSTDGTVALVEAKSQAFRHAPVVFARETPSGSASANFASLLNRSDADYVFLADHDDIWLPEKIELGLGRMRKLEAECEPGTPALVHGDLAVIDGEANPLAPSFWAFKSIHPEYGASLRTALMHPTVTGCTAVMNRALVERVRQIPSTAVMHDWWIGLAAAAFGAVAYDPEPHIRYRIHGGNVSAPKRSSLLSALKRMPAPSDVRRWVRLRLDQGAEFLSVYREELPEQSRRALEEFVSIRMAGPISRRRTLLAGGFRSPDMWRNAAAVIYLSREPSDRSLTGAPA